MGGNSDSTYALPINNIGKVRKAVIDIQIRTQPPSFKYNLNQKNKHLPSEKHTIYLRDSKQKNNKYSSQRKNRGHGKEGKKQEATSKNYIIPRSYIRAADKQTIFPSKKTTVPRVLRTLLNSIYITQINISYK